MSNYTKTTNFASKDNLSPGNPLKIVKGTEIDTEFNNIQTAVATKTDNSAANITGGSITGITDLAVADGGTGASTATAALNNLLPTQTGNANKYLQTDGTNATWDAVTLSTADITGTLPVANGGTGVTSSTGTGSVVLSNSPTLVTPALGTPASGTATNLTGLPISTGVSGLGTGVATFLGTPSSANLLAAVTDETGTGALVFATSPTLVTPALGTPASATLTNATGLPISTGVSGLGTGVATALAVNVGSAGAPVINGGALGTPTSATLTNATGLPIATGVSGLGTGVATALAVNVGSSGAPLVNGGVLGTPSSGTATNLTGLPLTTGVTGTLPVANGGTNLTSFTSGGVVYASSSSALATGSALTFDGTNLTQTGSSGTLKFDQNQSASGAIVNTKTATTGNSLGAYDQFATKDNTGTANTWAVGVNINSANSSWELYNGGTRYSITQTGTSIWSVGGSEGMRLTSTGLGIGTTSPVAKNHIRGSGTSGQVTASWILENASSGASGMDITGSAGASRWRFLYTGAGPSTGTNTFSEAMCILTEGASAGNVGIGTSSPDVFANGFAKNLGVAVTGSGATASINVSGGSGGAGRIQFGTETTRYGLVYVDASNFMQIATTTALPISFGTNNTERARITSDGYLLVGKTVTTFTTDGVALQPAGTAYMSRDSDITLLLNRNGSDGQTAAFYKAGTQVGNISVTGSLTSYNVSSDYRLKNTIAPMTGALAKVALLKPCTYKWNVDGSDGEGFIAHELAEVVPHAVTGAKDAVDVDGKPVHQGIDVSFLVATLTAAIQEQQTIIESLKARLDAANL